VREARTALNWKECGARSAYRIQLEGAHMKRNGLIAVVVALAAASAYAQQVFEPAVPRGLPETRVEPSGELALPAQPAEPPQLVMNMRRHQSDADARRCLQLATNRQIHRCAQPYLPAAAARLVRATAKADTAPAASRARASDLAKPDLSKAAEPAKPAGQAAAQPAPPKTSDVVKSAPADKSGSPKWTDNAKGVMQKQGERLTKRIDEEK
jgi:hypothetical protein